VTVEKQNIDLEMPVTLREILEIAKDDKVKSVFEVVEEILINNDMLPKEAKKLADPFRPEERGTLPHHRKERIYEV